MSFLLFLRGFIGVLVVFAIATYAVTQSPWTTVINTVICAVILQAGYFLAVLALVWRPSGRNRQGDAVARSETIQTAAKEDRPAGKAARLPGVPRSPHP